MKKGVIVFGCLALLFSMCVPVVAQPSSRAVETIVIDTFDNEGDLYLGEYEWTWNVNSSRYVDSDGGYPKMNYFEGQPNSLRVLNKNKNDDSTPLVLGVNISFQRKGENWFEVYPEQDGKPFEIPLIGNVTQIDFWVWGSKYRYYIDLLVRDADGRVHTLSAGNLAFEGWKNLIIKVPANIRQQSRLHSGPTEMTFVGFRIRSDPNEYVDDFTVFFDQFKYTTNTLSNIFDGYELKNVDFGESESESETSENGESQGESETETQSQDEPESESVDSASSDDTTSEAL